MKTYHEGLICRMRYTSTILIVLTIAGCRPAGPTTDPNAALDPNSTGPTTDAATVALFDAFSDAVESTVMQSSGLVQPDEVALLRRAVRIQEACAGREWPEVRRALELLELDAQPPCEAVDGFKRNVVLLYPCCDTSLISDTGCEVYFDLWKEHDSGEHPDRVARVGVVAYEQFHPPIELVANSGNTVAAQFFTSDLVQRASNTYSLLESYKLAAILPVNDPKKKLRIVSAPNVTYRLEARFVLKPPDSGRAVARVVIRGDATGKCVEESEPGAALIEPVKVSVAGEYWFGDRATVEANRRKYLADHKQWGPKSWRHGEKK